MPRSSQVRSPNDLFWGLINVSACETLHRSSAKSAEPSFEVHARQRADVEARDFKGLTPLLLACKGDAARRPVAARRFVRVVFGGLIS